MFIQYVVPGNPIQRPAPGQSSTLPMRGDLYFVHRRLDWIAFYDRCGGRPRIHGKPEGDIAWANPEPMEIATGIAGEKSRWWRDFLKSAEFANWWIHGSHPETYESVWKNFSRKWLKNLSEAESFRVGKALRRIKASERKAEMPIFDHAPRGHPWHQLGDWRPATLRERQTQGLARMEFSSQYGGEWFRSLPSILAEAEFMARFRDSRVREEKQTFLATLRTLMSGEGVEGFQSTSTRAAQRKTQPPSFVMSNTKFKEFRRFLQKNKAGLHSGVDVNKTCICLFLYHRVGMQTPDISAYFGIPQKTIENIIFLRTRRAIIYFNKLERVERNKKRKT